MIGRKGILSGLLVMLLSTSISAQAPGDKAAAVVNGESILQSEVKLILDQRPLATPVPEEQARAIRRAALDMLIDDALMRQFLRKNVAPANPAEIEATVEKVKASLKEKNKTLEEFLREEKQTEQQLRADIATEIQWKTYLSTKYTEVETRSYYEQNKPYFDMVRVRAGHILVRVSANDSITDRQQARLRLENIRQEILSGKIQFQEAARKYSQCPSRDQGGDIGFFSYKFMVVDPFARAAFNLRVGDMSDIVATDFGLHLIKVIDRDNGKPSSYDAMRDVVRKTMAQEEQLFQRILAEQKRIAQVQVLMQ